MRFSTVSIVSPLRFFNMKLIYFCCIPVQADVARGLVGERKKEKKKRTLLSSIKKFTAQLDIKIAKISYLK